MKIKTVFVLFIISCFVFSVSAQRVYEMSEFGIKPDSKKNVSGLMEKALKKIRSDVKNGE